MADWRQIQARIRKAKNSSEPQAKLTDLYQRTRDAMVAWELGCIEEAVGHGDEAAKWYATAHGRFRRSDWKKKAEDALARLGVEVPATPQEPEHIARREEAPADRARETNPKSAARTDDLDETGEAGETEETGEIREEMTVQSEVGQNAPAAQSGEGQTKKRRRRGRRGGRGRGRKGATAGQGLPSTAYADAAKGSAEARPERAPLSPERAQPEPFVERRRLPEPAFQPAEPARPSAATAQIAPPQLPSERVAHGRSDPGLASRMAHLESMLRRLVTSPLHRLDEADEAPAGPGVFLLSESDQSTSYYIEWCQTLRIGLANLTRGSGGRNVRGSRGGRGSGDSNLKSRLADYLGINEAKVTQYMKDHCAVRWIQLDDEAPYLAQFAIGVLRAPLNFED